MSEVTESIEHVVEPISDQKLGEELSAGPRWSKIERNSNEGPTPENDVADSGDYSLFFQGISNRPECYDLDQRHETGKIAGTCVKHTLSYQNETDDSDLYWKNDGHYPINPRDSALIKLDLPLTENEKSLIDEFCKELKGVVAKNDQGYRDKHENFTNTALERIECITNKYLQKGIRLNSKCNDDEYTITSLIFKEIRDIPAYEGVSDDENIGVIRNIMNNLLLKGGRVKYSSFYDDRLLYATYGFSYEIFAEREEIDNKLKSVAYEGIINSSAKGKALHAEMDNGYFYAKYSQDSTVEVAKVINNPKVKDLSFRHHIFHIGESIVRVENVGGKRNYTDVLGGSVEMSFTTQVGKISVHLCSSDKDSNIIEVKLDGESQEKFDKLKGRSSLGESCLLGGKSVLQAVKDGNFERNVSIESSKTIKQLDCVVKESDAPSTLMRPIDSLDQLQKMEVSKEIVVCS
ncbi:hypothetical protein [Wolbachia endosymbiont (group A) of Beris morrisii]|uniref:hypothetical protein n=1 Tax=Wolbachia endosymbiont (group A) of Beris morrisii TaxID=3066139 RepID=UPI003341537D